MKNPARLLLALLFFLALACAGPTDTTVESDTAVEPEVLEPAPMQLVLMGGPGSGKGTQASFLKETYSIPHISTGQLLRDEVAAGTELGKRVEGVMARGELVDDETVLALVRDRLQKPETAAGFILDGFPRTREQVDGLEALLQNRPDPRITAILLEVSDEEMLRRLMARGRADDTEDAIRSRIEKFHVETVDAIGFYEERGQLLRIDGEQPIEDVTIAIEAALGYR